MTAPTGAPSWVAELIAALPEGRVQTDADVLSAYRYDEAWGAEAGVPTAIAFPRTTEEVQALVRVASRSSVPIVPRGAGSGLAGAANAIDGCLVLSLQKMDAIVSIEPGDLVATVQPGVINADLSRAVREHGLSYPPDPASWERSTIGGNLATDAGGLCCVKYGVTSDYVLGLEVVLADGRVVRTGRRTPKGVAGYDLTRLLVGSEGTLGIITEATLRLTSAPLPASTVAAFFDTLEAAGAAVVAIVGSGQRPSLLEIMDRTTVVAVDEWKQMGLDRSAAALLLAQSDAGGEQAQREMGAVEAACHAHGATYVAHTDDPIEGEQLMAARRLGFPALERQGAALLDDVAVPRSAIPALLAHIEQIAATHGVLIGTFGHAGDGNMHPTIVFDPSDAAATAAAQAAFEDMVAASLDFGGTVTGEHGVGLLKRDHLARELGPVGIDLHRAVKHAFDPEGILNPGKVVAPAPPPAPMVLTASADHVDAVAP